MAETGSSNMHDVMISYNSRSKETVLKIRDNLRQNGVTCWIDVEQMSGSILDAMSAAVENCTVFLMCYSTGYSKSDNCKSEAEYAKKKKKIIVPCKIEKDYDPSGWLGIIIGSKLFFDFTGKYTFENQMESLLREIKLHLKKEGVSIMERPRRSNNLQEVMISYNYSNTKIALKIRDNLREKGISCWIDVDNAEGLRLEDMAHAVENCSVMLMCYSEKYKDNQASRTEAEYAYSQGKPIIPCLMENSYQPTGWLASLIGTKPFYDFSGRYSFERTFERLLCKINDHLQKSD